MGRGKATRSRARIRSASSTPPVTALFSSPERAASPAPGSWRVSKSETDHPVGFLDQAGDIRRRDPAAAAGVPIAFSRPTGDPAGLSNVDRHLMGARLGEQV